MKNQYLIDISKFFRVACASVFLGLFLADVSLAATVYTNNLLKGAKYYDSVSACKAIINSGFFSIPEKVKFIEFKKPNECIYHA